MNFPLKIKVGLFFYSNNHSIAFSRFTRRSITITVLVLYFIVNNIIVNSYIFAITITE